MSVDEVSPWSCHICAEIKASGVVDLCPCCDYDGCLHADDPVEILDWWLFSGSSLPLTEWFVAEVEKHAWPPRSW